jgi:hypothetical protein
MENMTSDRNVHGWLGQSPLKAVVMKSILVTLMAGAAWMGHQLGLSNTVIQDVMSLEWYELAIGIIVSTAPILFVLFWGLYSPSKPNKT